MYNPFSLKGKTVLVTGASSGIGRTIAIECSKMGAQLFITGRNIERLTATFEELEKGANHQFLPIDITSTEDINKLVNVVGNIDGLVNAAGIMKTLPFKFMDSQSLDDVMQANFVGPALLTKELVSKKKLQNNGSIVFISSISGNYVSTFGNTLYSASKGALDSFAKNIALEVASRKIRVNTVNPGMIETNFFSENKITEEQLKQDINRYPLKRFGKTEEVAYASIYLLSDASLWVTGASLLIDGGYTLQ